MIQTSIAIIGMSGVFPEANDIYEFANNLRNGSDSVRKLSIKRLTETGLQVNRPYQKNGYLTEIDKFDYRFFQLSKHEADDMDPHQRLLLQLVCDAIYNAGRSLDELRASRTAVILGSPASIKSNYLQRLPDSTATAISGNLASLIAGRISHVLDLRGPAMMLDAACSSSLLAVHEASQKLLVGEVDYALAGALNLFLEFPLVPHRDENELGVESVVGQCRAFDARADGIVGGEGGGIVLLKRLDHALHDHDRVLAVIRGGSVNHDGARSASITAPSPMAQREVLVDAWRRSGVDPRTISYIEAHGTGTKLGDPIEIQALTDAFRTFTDDQGFCRIGSVKTNIGHLGCASGIASLIKVVLSISEGKLFSSLHFESANPLIDFDNSAVVVNDRLVDWHAPVGDIRRAGVSSFGLSGTNVHIVIEESPMKAGPMEERYTEHRQDYLLTLSAKSPTALRSLAKSMLDHLEQHDLSIDSLAFNLNRGRDHYEYRWACVCTSKTDFTKYLRDQFPLLQNRPPTSFKRGVALVFPASIHLEDNVIGRLSKRYPTFRNVWETWSPVSATMGSSGRTIVLLYALAAQIEALGVHVDNVWGIGLGEVVSRVVIGELRMEEALRLAAQEGLKESEIERLDRGPSELSPIVDHNSMVVGLGSKDDFKFHDPELACKIHPMFDADAATMESLNPLMKWLYTKGVNVNWTQYYSGQEIARVELPGYPFEKVCCWAAIQKEVTENRSTTNMGRADFSVSSGPLTIQQRLGALWTEVFDKDCKAEDDFFELGGNSLVAARLVSRVRQQFGVSVEFDDFLTHATLAEMADLIRVLSRNPSPNVVDKSRLVLSSAQESIWVSHQLFDDKSIYNVPVALQMSGHLNVTALHESITEIVHRHEVLRSYFPEREGTVTWVVSPEPTYSFEYREVSQSAGARIDQVIRDEVKIPMDPENGPVLRVVLFRTGVEEHVLLILMHHMVADGWSRTLFVQELIQLYNASCGHRSSPLPALRTQYRDYAMRNHHVLQGARLAQLNEFWNKYLDGAPFALRMLADYPRPALLTSTGRIQSFRLSKSITEKLHAFARSNHITPFMVLLSAWSVLLNRITGQEDMLIGTMVSGRDSDTEEIIGLFINTVPIRIQLTGNPTFLEVAGHVKESTARALSHQDLPLNKIMDLLQAERSANRHSLIQVAFNFLQNDALIPELDMTQLHVEFLQADPNGSKFDILLTVQQAGREMIGQITYNPAMFRAATVARMVNLYVDLCGQYMSEPQTRIRLDEGFKSSRHQQGIDAFNFERRGE